MLHLIKHPVQVSHCIFDLIIFVLSCPAFGRQHSTSVDILEITIGKLVPSFGTLAFFVVDPQIPFPEFVQPV
jgi:hypothetical protein